MITLACYCDDCQTAGRQIDQMPNGRSGLQPDGGTPSVMFRKDRVQCTRGKEHLIDHKLKPSSHTTRVIASCCNSNMSTRFDNWYPMVALRTHSQNVDAVQPQICICTKFAPDADKIAIQAPRHSGVAPSFVLKLLAASVQLGFQRIPTDNRVY
jgi:hypothetical protein